VLRRRLILIIVFTLIAGACGDDSGSTTTTGAAAVATQPPATQAPTPTTAPPTTQATAPTIDPGVDIFLDGLWDLCNEGDWDACDQLFLEAEEGSDYQAFGVTCGGRTDGEEWCVDEFGFVGVTANVGLYADGIGNTFFGDDADGALESLIADLGSPVLDDGWTDAALSFCEGTMVRFPQWDGVFVILTDAATAYAPAGSPHIAFWAAWEGSPFATETYQVTPGITTLGEVIDRVGSVVPTFDALLGIWTFEAPAGTLDAGMGTLDFGIVFEVSDPNDMDAAIVGASAGQPNICGE